eukprot:820772-Rhodomonas_salina.2
MMCRFERNENEMERYWRRKERCRERDTDTDADTDRHRHRHRHRQTEALCVYLPVLFSPSLSLSHTPILHPHPSSSLARSLTLGRGGQLGCSAEGRARLKAFAAALRQRAAALRLSNASLLQQGGPNLLASAQTRPAHPFPPATSCRPPASITPVHSSLPADPPDAPPTPPQHSPFSGDHVLAAPQPCSSEHSVAGPSSDSLPPSDSNASGPVSPWPVPTDLAWGSEPEGGLGLPEAGWGEVDGGEVAGEPEAGGVREWAERCSLPAAVEGEAAAEGEGGPGPAELGVEGAFFSGVCEDGRAGMEEWGAESVGMGGGLDEGTSCHWSLTGQ